LPVDCGVVKVRHGVPELHLAQLDPFDDKKVLILVVARYMRDLFLSRADVNKDFMQQLDEKIFSMAPRGEPGHFTRLLAEASPTDATRVMFLDVFLETMLWVSDRVGVTLYTVAHDDMSRVMSGASSSATISVYAQFVMSVRACADLLLSWERVDAELRR
jgi:hypothetical protein